MGRTVGRARATAAADGAVGQDLSARGTRTQDLSLRSLLMSLALLLGHGLSQGREDRLVQGLLCVSC